MMRRPTVSTFAAGLFALLLDSVAGAAVIVVTPIDGVGEGFNDPTPVAPVGGNPGTTRGQQRLNAFQYAADIWGAIVKSDVTIEVEAAFDPLPCSASSATLGQAGPISAFHDFVGAPLANTWYPVALGNALAGLDLDPGVPDIGATFNSSFGAGCAFPVGFYYGLDANPGSDTDFVSVVLHEIGHGLGFLTFVDRNPSSGNFGGKFAGLDDAYMVNLEDHSTGLIWPALTNGQRATSMTDTGDLHWVGATVVAASGFLTAGRHASGHVQMYAPNPLQGGSSISHWDSVLVPNQVMEPAYTGPLHDPGLATALMVDLGWSLLSCGDGVIDAPESCDDGNDFPNDGCSPTCRTEECFSCTGQPSVCTPLGDGVGCDDGDECTQTDTCASNVCVGSNPVVCNALDVCHVVGTCNPLTGACSNPPAPDGTACNDGDACTGPDGCAAGECVGLPSCIGNFLCYKDKTTAGTPQFVPVANVQLIDQFETLTVTASKPKHLCTPANLLGNGFVDTTTHLLSYQIKPATGSPKHVPKPNLEITNSLVIHVNTIKPDFLMVPSSKDPNVDPPLPGPNEVDHYKCYKIKTTPGTPKFPKGALGGSVVDQFGVRSVTLIKPSHLCTPVEKNGEPIKHAAVHQLCYKVKPTPATAKQVGLHTNNQFGQLRIDTIKEDLLCVPSLKELP
jgi:cysteine-rich repeat protein